MPSGLHSGRPRDALGGIDVLVTNAGGPPAGGPDAVTVEQYAEAFSLNALSVPEFWQQAVNGALLLLAIAVDKVINDRRTRQVTTTQEVPA